MKALMILGALVGFLIGGSSGLTGRSSWPTALWRASAGALMAGILTRWWIQVWFHGLNESLKARRSHRPVLNLSSKPVAKT